MDPKRTILIFTIVGGTLGGYVPALWGDGYMSMSSVLFTFVGGILGIWIGYKVSR